MIFLRTNWPNFVYKATFLYYELIYPNASESVSVGCAVPTVEATEAVASAKIDVAHFKRLVRWLGGVVVRALDS